MLLQEYIAQVVAKSKESLILTENEAFRFKNASKVSEKNIKMIRIHGIMCFSAIFITVRCCSHAVNKGLSFDKMSHNFIVMSLSHL